MAIEGVIFDLGNVLVDWNPRHLYRKLLPDEAAVDDFLTNVCTMDWHMAHDAGVSFADNAEPLIEQFPHHEDLIRAWGDRFLEMIPGPIDGMTDIVAGLKGRGLALYGLTNHPNTLIDDTFWNQPFGPYFEGVTVSGIDKLTKPGPDIYKLTASRMNLPEEALLFIDDSPKNVDGARAVGMTAIHFQGPDALRMELRGLGLLD